jgi:hypothetical protein
MALFAGLLLGVSACRGPGTAKPAENPSPVTPIADTIVRHAPELMKIPGVVGVYEGETRRHVPCIRIMVERRTPELEHRLPRRLEGHPVEIDETGVIRPMRGS